MCIRDSLDTIQECFGDGVLMFFDALTLGLLALYTVSYTHLSAGRFRGRLCGRVPEEDHRKAPRQHGADAVQAGGELFGDLIQELDHITGHGHDQHRCV